jgi:hypothetical protein
MSSFTTLPPVDPLLVFRNGNDEQYKTILLFGVNRSGTSVTAALLDAMGVAMDGSNDGHFERPMFKGNLRDDTALCDEVARLNEAHDTWGLQCRHELKDMLYISSLVRNPHLVAVFRDPAAISSRWLSISEKGIKEPKGAILQIWSETSSMLGALLELLDLFTFPTACVSFEKLKQDPCKMAHTLAQWMRIEPRTVDVAKVVGKESGYLIQ